MNGLSLFSGIGGIDVALSKYVRPITYVEIDPYCRGVLLSNMSRLQITAAPIWDDVTTFEGRQYQGIVDIIYGGFPCQDISVAGNGKGLEGKRSGLFFEIVRLVREIQPTFVFLENSPQLRTRGLDTIIKEFAKAGFLLRWTCIRASDVGARHHRERMFLLAYSESKRQQATRLPMREEKKQPRSNLYIKHEVWSKEPEDKLNMAGMADGIPFRTHRIRSLGNAVVPCQVKKAFEILMGYHGDRSI